MKKITLDPETVRQLGHMAKPVEVWDASGQLLGYLIPPDDPGVYRGLQSHLSEDELQRREQEVETLTTSEVLAELENL